MRKPYTIEEHSHRFAAWAASTAASVKGCRFKVHEGKEILEAAGFSALFCCPDDLPTPDNIDDAHQEWCENIIIAAGQISKDFKHGSAAKLINCYLKSRFSWGAYHNDEKVQCLHPPIDNTLLVSLANSEDEEVKKMWKGYKNKKWSRFNHSEYIGVIKLIRKSFPDTPLWKVECFWPGYQGNKS